MSTTGIIAPQMVEDYTFREACSVLRIARSTLYRFLYAGKLTGKKVGARWRFEREVIHNFRVDYSLARAA